MMTASGTSEEDSGHCPKCGRFFLPATSSSVDQLPCPHCGHLIWYAPNSVKIWRPRSREDLLRTWADVRGRLARGRLVLINLKDVDSIGSSDTIGTLVRMAHHFRLQGSKLVYCGIHDRDLAETLSLVGLNIHPDEDSGLAAFDTDSE